MSLRQTCLYSLVFLLLPAFLQCPLSDLTGIKEEDVLNVAERNKASERYTKMNDAMRRHDVKALDQLIQDNQGQADLRYAKAAIQIAQGDVNGGIRTAAQAKGLPEMRGNDTDGAYLFSWQLGVALNFYSKGTPEYGRLQSAFCGQASETNRLNVAAGRPTVYNLSQTCPPARGP